LASSRSRLIGEGGFGIVYLAEDRSLGRRIALKEYLPVAIAARATECRVSVLSERHTETFNAGLRSFVNEARLLAQFDHPVLVKVYRFWVAIIEPPSEVFLGICRKEDRV
jgi:serine/threonine protein kinase